MPQLEVSPALAGQLERAARERGCSVEQLLAGFVGAADPALATHPLIAYTLSSEYRVKFSDADRFLALLGWVAARQPAEFDDFVSHLESRRKYVGLSAEEIRETCQHNQARPIPGSHFWAIMNLDTPTKQRFLRRLLVFVGETDEVIEAAVATVGPGRGQASRTGAFAAP
jgi:negative modulator of initiation of replication